MNNIIEKGWNNHNFIVKEYGIDINVSLVDCDVIDRKLLSRILAADDLIMKITGNRATDCIIGYDIYNLIGRNMHYINILKTSTSPDIPKNEIVVFKSGEEDDKYYYTFKVDI